MPTVQLTGSPYGDRDLSVVRHRHRLYTVSLTTVGPVLEEFHHQSGTNTYVFVRQFGLEYSRDHRKLRPDTDLHRNRVGDRSGPAV